MKFKFNIVLFIYKMCLRQGLNRFSLCLFLDSSPPRGDESKIVFYSKVVIHYTGFETRHFIFVCQQRIISLKLSALILIRTGISAQHVFYGQENKAKQQNAGVVFPVICNYTSDHNSKITSAYDHRIRGGNSMHMTKELKVKKRETL